MKTPKMIVLTEAGVVCEVEAEPAVSGGWVVWITYATSLNTRRREILERQRGGTRVFATLDAVARCLAAAGLREFIVSIKQE